MKCKIYFRTDGNSEIGLGHLVRCISLSFMLNDSFEIHFFSLKIPSLLQDQIRSEGWSCSIINNEFEFFSKLMGNEIVILDGYHFDSFYQKQIKEKGCKLVCIDDFHNQYFYADLVINHAPGAVKGDYDGEQYTKYLLGPDYALLRPEFLENTSYENKKNSNHIENIFICFGGSDFKNLTAKVLSWLPSENYIVTLVLGNAYSHQDELNKVIEEREDLEIIVKKSLNTKEMRNELEQTDLAIVPASGILFEVISTGTPVVSGFYTENQRAIYEGFLYKSVFIDSLDFNKQKFTHAFNIAKEANLESLIENQSKMIDGNSAYRIKKSFLALC